MRFVEIFLLLSTLLVRLGLSVQALTPKIAMGQARQ